MSRLRSLGWKAERVKRSVAGGSTVECPTCGAGVDDDRETCPDCGATVERIE